MGFIKPDLPVVDRQQWVTGSLSERVRPIAQHLADRGWGAPLIIHLFYAVKIVLYILGAALFALATKGIDGFSNIAQWWSEPIVFQKAILFTMLFEVLGLGCSFGPLAGRYNPPMGSVLYWLRPGTIRLAPWPNRVPLTRGTNRTPVDAALYAAFLILLVAALVSDGSRPIPSLGTDIGVLAAWHTISILAVLAVLSLRDKVIFLATRGEVYVPLAVAFLLTGPDMIVAAKLVFMVIWVGAATSKLNKHFPFVISTMMANSPLLPSRRLKRLFFTRYPDDLRPSRISRFGAHFSTAIEGLVPFVLLLSHGGGVTAVAAFVMVVFHLGILTAFPMGVPLEWNVFMIFGVLSLFVAHTHVSFSDVTQPWLIALIVGVSASVVVWGNLSPRQIAFLPGMRYYAGNWDTSLWCIKPSADDKIVKGAKSLSDIQHRALEKIYGSKEEAELPIYINYAFRSMNTHGRALFTLVHRAMAGSDESDYNICEGEMIAATALGWNFGDGHMHNETLINALHERCQFEPGEVRVVILDGQPIQRQTQQYRLVDAATGQFESGYVNVADMVVRQPWSHDVPVHVDQTAARN